MALNGVDSLSLSAGPSSLLFFPLGFGRLGYFRFVFKSHVSHMCLFRSILTCD